MPITVSWYDDTKQALIMRYVGLWDWKMYYNAVDTITVALYEVAHPVLVIVEMSNMVGYPEDTSAQFTRSAHLLHLNVKGIALIVRDASMRYILGKIMDGDSAASKLMYFAHDIAEALEIGNK